MATTMCASGAAIIKAGASASLAEATRWDTYIEEAEAYLCDIIKYDAVTNWTSLNAVYKLIFTEYCARSAAIEGIFYDTTGYATDEDSARIVAEDMANIHFHRMNIIIKLLEKPDVQDFMTI